MNAAVVQRHEVQTERREGSGTEKRNNSLLQKWLLLVRGPQLRLPHNQGSSCSRADCPKPGKRLHFGHCLTPVLTYGQGLSTEAETLERSTVSINRSFCKEQRDMKSCLRVGMCVCVLYGGWSPYLQFRAHLWWVSVCLCVCVSLLQGKKAAIFIYVNPWSSFSWMADTFSVLTLSTSPLPSLRHSAKVSYSHEDRLLCMLLTILGSEPSGKRSLTIFNNERVNLLSEFLGAWGLPFPSSALQGLQSTTVGKQKETPRNL